MSEGTGEGSASRASSFQIYDSSSEGEQSDIPVREITEESPYDPSENSSSVGAPAPVNEEAAADPAEIPQEDVAPQESIEVVEVEQSPSAPREGSSSSSERGTPGTILFSALCFS